MKAEPTKVEINGRNYLIGDWDVDKSLETMVWIVKTFGEGFLSLFMTKDGFESIDGVVNGDVETDEERAIVKEFATKILDNIDPKEYAKYAKIICAGVRCNAKEIDFKFHFVRRMGELHLVMFHVLKHQYGDFLGAGAGDE